MKRSEMLKLIQDCWADTTSFPTDVAVAKYILDTIEKQGMLPPKQQNSVQFSEHSINGRTEYEYFNVNTWESE